MSKLSIPTLKTEAINPKYKGVDEWPMDQILTTLLDDQITSLIAIRTALPHLAHGAEQAVKRLDASETSRIVWGGAGTSGFTGLQDKRELFPTYGWPEDRLALLFAGGNRAIRRPVENAEDNIQTAVKMTKALKLTANDVFIGVAASGTTPYTIAACKVAREAGALTICISSNDNSPLLQAAEIEIFVDTGSEPVNGSTRMNAGTVQTVILKMLSTSIMVQLGRVYDGYMVSMIPTNAKLRLRARNMVSEITGCTPPQATRALARAKEAFNGVTDKNIKLAILLAQGAGVKEAKETLEAARYHLRPALTALTI